MKNLKTVAKESISDINKKIKQSLCKGEIVTGIGLRGTGELCAKVTQTIIGNIRYYGMWEKDLLEGKWHLLNFGAKKEVWPEWNDYIDFWKNYGTIYRMIA